MVWVPVDCLRIIVSFLTNDWQSLLCLERVSSSFHEAVSSPVTRHFNRKDDDDDDDYNDGGDVGGVGDVRKDENRMSSLLLLLQNWSQMRIDNREIEDEQEEENIEKLQPQKRKVTVRNTCFQLVFFDLLTYHCTDQVMHSLRKKRSGSADGDDAAINGVVVVSSEEEEQVCNFILPVMESLQRSTTKSEPCWSHLKHDSLQRKIDQHMKSTLDLGNSQNYGYSSKHGLVTVAMIRAELVAMARYFLFDLPVSCDSKSSGVSSDSASSITVIDWKDYCKRFVMCRVLKVPPNRVSSVKHANALRAWKQKTRQLAYVFQSYRDHQKQHQHTITVSVAPIVDSKSTMGSPYASHHMNRIRHFLDCICLPDPSDTYHHYIIIGSQVYRLVFEVVQSSNNHRLVHPPSTTIADQQTKTATLFLVDLVDPLLSTVDRESLKRMQAHGVTNLVKTVRQGACVMCAGIGSDEFQWLQLWPDEGHVRSFLTEFGGMASTGVPLVEYMPVHLNDPDTCTTLLNELARRVVVESSTGGKLVTLHTVSGYPWLKIGRSVNLSSPLVEHTKRHRTKWVSKFPTLDERSPTTGENNYCRSKAKLFCRSL